MLERFVGRFHVGTPDREVRAAVRARVRSDLTASERRTVLDAAVRIHRRNRRLYVRVMGGRR